MCELHGIAGISYVALVLHSIPHVLLYEMRPAWREMQLRLMVPANETAGGEECGSRIRMSVRCDNCDNFVCGEYINSVQTMFIGVKRGFEDARSHISMVHHPIAGETTYIVYRTLYYILERRGDILDTDVLA